MRYVRPYFTETAVKPGRAVARGSAEHKVKAHASDGSGDFIGIYGFEANDEKAAGDQVGITLTGAVKARAGGAVSAGGGIEKRRFRLTGQPAGNSRNIQHPRDVSGKRRRRGSMVTYCLGGEASMFPKGEGEKCQENEAM